ncbi:PIN domain-containing protein [Acidobacteriota bacterium]
MSAKYFLDTNVFVYSFDASAVKKRKVALELIHRALAEGQGIISWQVVQEFLNVATTKFEVPLSSSDCERYIDQVLAPMCEVYPSMTLYKSGLSIHEATKYGYYDSLIIAAALEAGCSTLFSEDLQAGRTFFGLTIENPFS